MKLWNSLKLTFYYGICLTVVSGKILLFKQRSVPAYRVTDGIPSENHDIFSIANSNPRKSDFVGHSDMSDKTVLLNGVDTNSKDNFHVSSNVLNGKENQPNGKNLKAIGRFENGKQIVLKEDTSIVSDHMNSPSSRLRRSVDRSRSVDLSLSPLRRHRRGFRSAVADRIAHGFGKRAQVLNIHQPDLDRLRDTLSQVHLGRAQELLSLAPEDLEEIESVLSLYDNVLEKLQKSNDRNEALDADSDTLSEIYEKLLSALQGSRYDSTRSAQDGSYVKRYG